MKARLQLKRLLTVGWFIVFLALFTFDFAASISLAIGLYCTYLSWHKRTFGTPKADFYRILSMALVLLSGLRFAAGFFGHTVE